MNISKSLDKFLWSDNYNQSNEYQLLNSNLISRTSLLVFRIFLAIFFLSTLIYQFIVTKNFPLLLYGQFCLIIPTLYSIFVIIETVFYKGNWPFFWKITHILFEISISIEFSSVIFFWVFVFPYNKKYITSHSKIFLNDFNVNFLVFGLLWIENIFNNIKIYIKHNVFLMIYCYFYFFIINLPYSFINKNIYYEINWKNFQSYVVGLFIPVFGIFHSIFFSYFYYRFLKFENNDKEEEELEF